MSWWAVGAIVVSKAYEGYQARQAGDRDALVIVMLMLLKIQYLLLFLRQNSRKK